MSNSQQQHPPLAGRYSSSAFPIISNSLLGSFLSRWNIKFFLFWQQTYGKTCRKYVQSSIGIHTKIAKKTYYSQVTPSDVIQTPYSWEPPDCDTLGRGMGDLERNPGTARRPQRSTSLPAPLQSRVSYLGEAGTAVWLRLTWAPAQSGTRPPHTGFVTLINPINQRCCQHHRLTLSISLYCWGPRESSAGVRFVLSWVGVLGLK